MRFALYERTRLDLLTTKYYIGVTDNYKNRCGDHKREYPDCVMLNLVDFDVGHKDDAELIEAAFIAVYRTNHGYDNVDNISGGGTSRYSQDQEARKAALKGKTSGARPCAFIDDKGIHHLFATQTALGKFLDIPANSVNDRLNDRLPRFKTLRAKHMKTMYYATDTRPDNAFNKEAEQIFQF